jgi:L-threonylcarbamoyladenylate synthase
LPEDAELFAQGLYAGLRQLDAVNADVIVVQALPATPDWLGVNDRLRRAAHDSVGIVASLLPT